MRRLRTVKGKQLAVFTLLIAFLMTSFGIVFHCARHFAIENVYQRMDSQAEYYVHSVDSQMKEAMRQQSDFFADRQLVFLADPILLSDYDRRNTLLSLKDRIFVLVTSNTLVKEGTLYIPDSDYVVTSDSVIYLDGEEQKKQLQDMKEQLGVLTFENDDLVYSLTESPYVESFSPHFYFQIVFDHEALVEQLNSFVMEEGGACWNNDEMGLFLEDSAGMGIAEEILSEFEQSDDDRKVKIGETTYLVSKMESEYLGILVQYCSEDAVLKEMNQYTMLFYFLALVAVVLAIVFSGYTERLINKPLQKLYASFQELQNGNLSLSISHASEDEFAYIYEGFNHMVGELQRVLDELSIQKSLIAQAELKQLQAQINPHFLYNSFFLLKARLAREDVEGAQELASYLGDYFKYITRNASDTVTLYDEVKHAEAYARIQESRFSSRIKLIWEELPQEARDIMVPRLIIQPILENSFKYGLESMEEGGILKVSYEQKPDRLILSVENNGEVTDTDIQAMKERLSDEYQGEVTAIVNINRRLKYFFGKEQGLGIEKGQLGGVRITIEFLWNKEV